VRVIRNGVPHGPRDPAFEMIEPGDRILEIIDNAGAESFS
jgi:hypothetical protein